MSESTIQLEYVKRPAKRLKFLLWAIVLLALVAAATTAWRRWDTAKWERAKLLYWQWRCLNYSPPPDEIVYDQTPTGKSPLLNGDPRFIPRIEDCFAGSPITAAATVPNCELQFESDCPAEFDDRKPPTVFMHDRAAPSGRHYLVIVRGDGFSVPYLRVGQLPLNYDVWSPGGWRVYPEPAGGGGAWEGPVATPPALPLRIYAGQADPNDSSHFTIRYEQAGRKGIVDGYVSDQQIDPNHAALDAFIAEVKLIPRSAK